MTAAATSSIGQTLANATREVLRRRTPDGHWEGELSSSALSTATASFALYLVCSAGGGERDGARSLRPLVEGGLRWLIRNQNPDGGWGDTDRSLSNISTTALCWAALAAGGPEADEAVRRAERWLERAAGSLLPERLAEAISARYGRDRTFSVPILTMCALAGRLGPEPDAWRLVVPLPFELAACPRQCFAALKLPVVSYALPALIAMGIVRHDHLKPWNPMSRAARAASRGRVLRVLREIQPSSGGFLEATPLTSFVTMSLAASGLADHPVTRDAVEFLARSVREDGSWPIDTNLATWVTTLAVNALAAGGDLDAVLPAEDREALVQWLLGQQNHTVHPYTMAKPGGWAWTDLPGGVPDADDTPGALLALHHLAPDRPEVQRAVASGIAWLLDLQNRDGGIPTFCRGWGTLPFDRSGCDLTAHALHAWNLWKPDLGAALQRRIETASDRAIQFLLKNQRPDGAWTPLWFGNQHARDEENPVYGTSRVLVALNALDNYPSLELMRAQGLDWLLEAQNQDGSWGGDVGCPGSVEETGLVLQALAPAGGSRAEEAVTRALRWLVERTDGGRDFPPSPIGFYFAKLWYYEREYPLIFALAGMNASRHSGSS